MKRCLSLLVALLPIVAALRADDFTTVDGNHYTHATIKRVEPDGLVIAYDDGVIKLKFQKLPPEIGKKYGYDPAKATEFQKSQQALELATYQATIKAKEPPVTTSAPQAVAMPASVVITKEPAPIVAVPAQNGVAENGSYYGELNSNGIPRTELIHGYYKKNGTYVRGYYRSSGQ